MCNMHYELLSNMFFLTGVNYKKTHMSKLQKQEGLIKVIQ